jgi:ferredoxin, 2Fe-2S
MRPRPSAGAANWTEWSNRSYQGPPGTGATHYEPIERTRRKPRRLPVAHQAKIPIGPFVMAKITYIDSAGTTRTVEGEAGSTVMETAINNGVPEIEAECGGACACSTCHVYIDEAWREKVGEPSPMEEDMLDFAFEVKPNSRLSCQIKVSEDLDGLVVTTPARQA